MIDQFNKHKELARVYDFIKHNPGVDMEEVQGIFDDEGRKYSPYYYIAKYVLMCLVLLEEIYCVDGGWFINEVDRHKIKNIEF